MTYFVLTKPDSPTIKRQVLMRSVVKSRRKDIGQQSEYVNDNPDMESFTLSLSESIAVAEQEDAPSHDGEVPLLVPGEKISDGTNQPPDTVAQQTAPQPETMNPPENTNNTDKELPWE